MKSQVFPLKTLDSVQSVHQTIPGPPRIDPRKCPKLHKRCNFRQLTIFVRMLIENANEENDWSRPLAAKEAP